MTTAALREERLRIAVNSIAVVFEIAGLVALFSGSLEKVAISGVVAVVAFVYAATI